MPVYLLQWPCASSTSTSMSSVECVMSELSCKRRVWNVLPRRARRRERAGEGAKCILNSRYIQICRVREETQCTDYAIWQSGRRRNMRCVYHNRSYEISAWRFYLCTAPTWRLGSIRPEVYFSQHHHQKFTDTWLFLYV